MGTETWWSWREGDKEARHTTPALDERGAKKMRVVNSGYLACSARLVGRLGGDDLSTQRIYHTRPSRVRGSEMGSED